MEKIASQNYIKKSLGRKIFIVLNTLFMSIIVFVCIYPFINSFATSFSSKAAVLAGKVTFLPIEFTTEAYTRIMKEPNFWNGYKYTIIYTLAGTLIAMIMTICCAYPLSRKDLPGRRAVSLFMVFTMYFGGGLIPNYVLISTLFYNSIWAIVIPGCISVYNMIVMKTFFAGINESLLEAAQIDGQGQLGILLKIVLPLSKPILATMVLFYAVGYWNDWFSPMLYVANDKQPITLFLRDIVMGNKLMAQSGQAIDASKVNEVVSQTLQSATIMLVTIPILCVYPFVQKYFVQGVMIGSIKE